PQPAGEALRGGRRRRGGGRGHGGLERGRRSHEIACGRPKSTRAAAPVPHCPPRWPETSLPALGGRRRKGIALSSEMPATVYQAKWNSPSDSPPPGRLALSSSTAPATATPSATLSCWATAAMAVAWLASSSLISA